MGNTRLLEWTNISGSVSRSGSTKLPRSQQVIDGSPAGGMCPPKGWCSERATTFLWKLHPQGSATKRQNEPSMLCSTRDNTSVHTKHDSSLPLYQIVQHRALTPLPIQWHRVFLISTLLTMEMHRPLILLDMNQKLANFFAFCFVRLKRQASGSGDIHDSLHTCCASVCTSTLSAAEHSYT